VSLVNSDADQPGELSIPQDLGDDLSVPEAEVAPEGREAGRHKWLTAGVGSVGAASFFSDSGHEITTALLPSFVTSVLHGSAASLGIIEGVSDALMGVTKLVGVRSPTIRSAAGGWPSGVTSSPLWPPG
jgi:hypothetical protein